MYIIKNKDINHHINNYLEIFKSERAIAFELQESEYRDLSKLISWYKQKKKNNEPLDRDNWVKEIGELGTPHDSSASFVFGFLILNWNRHTHIAIEKSGNDYLVKVNKMVRH